MKLRVKERHIVIVTLICIGLILFWWKRASYERRMAAVVQEEMYEEDLPEDFDTIVEPEPELEEKPLPVAPLPVPDLPPPPSSVGVSQERLEQAFGQALRDAGTCLELKTGGGDAAEPTLENWMAVMRGEIGEPVIQTEDWSVIHLDVGGEKRRIRIEMDYGSDERVVRRLKYFKVDAAGNPGEQIALTKEQSEDPTETFIASLEKDGQTTAMEKMQRIYFQNGEEIVVTEKNNRVADIEMNRNGRSFRCQKMDSIESFCKCL